MSWKCRNSSKGEDERCPGRVNAGRDLAATCANEARLERVWGHKVDRAERSPVEVQLARRVSEVQPPKGDRRLSCTVHHPPLLRIARRLTAPSGVAERCTRQTSHYKSRTPHRDHTAVLIAPVSQGSQGQAPPRPHSKRAVTALKSRGRSDQRAASQSTFEEVSKDVARVPQVVIQY